MTVKIMRGKRVLHETQVAHMKSAMDVIRIYRAEHKGLRDAHNVTLREAEDESGKHTLVEFGDPSVVARVYE